MNPDKNEPVPFKKKLEDAEEKQNENWQSFNLSKKKALAALNENYEEIVKYQSKYFKKQAEDCWENVVECKERCSGGSIKNAVTLKRCQNGCNEEMCKMYEKNAEMDR